MLNSTHTYQVSYYGPEELAKPAAERGYPKHARTRATSAKRAISAVTKQLQEAAPAGSLGKSARHWLILEAKVVA
ncbi:hypothetical protein SEA_GUYFAGIERI_65 [Rhodococcus phage GuyFagieri]|nr:hypothetical protein SEA_GUYFAGIERI_65 [Rhodococcus phage GuyFagieri]